MSILYSIFLRPVEDRFSFFLFLRFIYFYFWLLWVFVALHGLSLAAIRGYSSLWYTGFSLRWLLLLRSMDSKAHGLKQLQHMGLVVVAPEFESTGSVVVVMGLVALRHVQCSQTRDWTQCPLHWQVDFLPLDHQGSPRISTIIIPI